MTADDFRRLALAFPNTLESAHCGHPDFRTEGKIYASLGAPDEHYAMVKLTPAQQAAAIQRAPRAFHPCNGVWGLRGCTNVLLAATTQATLGTALQEAWNNVQPAQHSPRLSRPKTLGKAKRSK